MRKTPFRQRWKLRPSACSGVRGRFCVARPLPPVNLESNRAAIIQLWRYGDLASWLFQQHEGRLPLVLSSDPHIAAPLPPPSSATVANITTSAPVSERSPLRDWRWWRTHRRPEMRPNHVDRWAEDTVQIAMWIAIGVVCFLLVVRPAAL